MALNQSLAEKRTTKPKGHLKYESLLKALPPDILKELTNRKLEEIERIRAQQKR
jgi:hypothetical protein